MEATDLSEQAKKEEKERRNATEIGTVNLLYIISTVSSLYILEIL